MTRRALKKQLAAAFPVPEPTGKRAFLRSLPPRPVSRLALLWVQAGHVRPVTWAVSLGVFAACLALGRLLPAEAVWMAAALTPFAALAAAAERGRPALYGMEELELAARFGLKSAVLARMGAVGLVHLALLALLAPLGPAGLVRTGVYLLTPYLLTDLMSLEAARRIRGREGLYVCAGAAVLTAGLAAGLHGVPAVYGPAGFPWWLAVLAAAGALTARAYAKTIQKTEELSWN